MCLYIYICVFMYLIVIIICIFSPLGPSASSYRSPRSNSPGPRRCRRPPGRRCHRLRRRHRLQCLLMDTTDHVKLMPHA